MRKPAKAGIPIIYKDQGSGLRCPCLRGQFLPTPFGVCTNRPLHHGSVAKRHRTFYLLLFTFSLYCSLFENVVIFPLPKNYNLCIIVSFAQIDACADIACQESAGRRATKIPRRSRGRLTDCEQDDAAKPMLTILDGKRCKERKGLPLISFSASRIS